MAGLLDFIQGASNAAAGTVAGPVDLINMGLLGVGLPMPKNPVGGSQWMREKGLMREPENRTMGLLGEAAGNVLPIVAAAKAPQIAQGLLTMADNAMAPTPMNAATRGQAGAVVWHGSPHKFDKFDSSKIGTGEGAQAYGHGLYFAENPAVAKSYADKLSGAVMFPQDVPAPVQTVVREALTVNGKKGNVAGPVEYLRAKQANLRHALEIGDYEKSGAIERALIDRYEDAIGVLSSKRFSVQEPNLYRVDLPDDAIARMLDYDAPLSSQPQTLAKLREWLDPKKVNFDTLPSMKGRAILSIDGPMATEMGKYRHAGMIADDLRALGITGVRYLDGGSRAAGAGNSNYVVFPGNEGLLKILGRE